MASLFETFGNALKKAYNKVGETGADVLEKVVPIKTVPSTQMPKIVGADANKIVAGYDAAPNKFAFKSNLMSSELNVLDRLRPDHVKEKSTPIFSSTVKAEPIKGNTTLDVAPSNVSSFESQLSRNPITGQRETGGYGDQVITMARNAPDALGNLFEKQVPVNSFIGGLDLRKTAKAAGTTLGSPISAIPSVGVGFSDSTEQVGQAKGIGDTFTKLTSVPIKTLMPLMDLIPGVLGFKFGTQASGLDEFTNKGTQSAKDGLASGFETMGIFDKEQLKELASNFVDGTQLFLSLLGGTKSSRVGGKEKVSGLQREVEIGKSVKSIREEAIKSGFSKKDASTLANEMIPVIRNAKPNNLLSDAQVLSSNLKNIGIDVAANAIIPVLGLAYNSYSKGEQSDFIKAIKESALQVAAGIAGIPKNMRTKPSEAQTTLNIEAGKNPDILEMNKEDTIMKTNPTGEQRDDAQAVLSGRKKIEEATSLTPEQTAALQERVNKKAKPIVPEVKAPETILETVTKSKKKTALTTDPKEIPSQVGQNIYFKPEWNKNKTVGQVFEKDGYTLVATKNKDGSTSIYEPTTGRFFGAYKVEGNNDYRNAFSSFDLFKKHHTPESLKGEFTVKKEFQENIVPLNILGVDFQIGKNEKGEFVLYDQYGTKQATGKKKSDLVAKTRELIERNGVDKVNKTIERSQYSYDEAYDYFKQLPDTEKFEILRRQGYDNPEFALSEINSSPKRYKDIFIDIFIDSTKGKSEAPIVQEVKAPETILETVTKAKKTKTPKVEKVETQDAPKIYYHGTSYDFDTPKSMRQIQSEGLNVEPANIGGRSPFIHLTESKDVARGYASARQRQTGKKGVVKEYEIPGKILDLTKEASDTERATYKLLGDELDKLSERRGSDAAIAASISSLSKDPSKGIYSSPYLANFNDIEASTFLPELLKKYGYSGIKIRDNKIVGGWEDTIAVLPEAFAPKLEKVTEKTKKVKPVKSIAEIIETAPVEKIVTPPIEEPVTPAPDLPFIDETTYKATQETNASIDLAKKQSEGDYTPEFKVGDITKILPTLSGLVSRNFNLSRFLDNIRVKVGEKFIPVGGYMEGAMRSMRANVRDAISGRFETDLANVDGKMKSGIDKMDLVGTTTTQGVPVTKANVDSFLKSYDNIDYYDKKLPGLTQKETNALVKASYVYDLVKQKGEAVLSKYFSPEQIAAFDALEKMERDIYGSTSKKAMDDGVYNGELNPDYLHFDMIRKNFERLPKKEQAGVTVNIDGQNVRFDNYLDAIDALDRAKRMGKKIDTDAFIALEQKKASNTIDPLRTHGALGRLLSYADGMGKAYGDQKVVDIFNDLQKTSIDQKTDSRIQDFLGWLNARGIKNPAEQMLAYSDNGTLAKISQGLSSIGSQAAITFNPKTYVQAVLSSGLKNTVDALGSAVQNMLSGNVKAGFSDLVSGVTGIGKTIANTALALGKKEIGQMTRAQKITDTLVRDGFVTGLEIGDRNLGNAFEVSSGLVQENAAKADVALRGMRRALLANGYKDLSTPDDIAKAWDQFRAKDVNSYIQAREQIRQDTRLIADVSRQARLTTTGLYNAAGALKTYMLGVINQAAQDSSSLANYITGKVSGSDLVQTPEAVNSIRRLALVYGAYAAAEAIVEEGLEQSGYVYDELSDEGKAIYDKIKKTYAQRISATPGSMLNEFIGGVVSNVGLSKAYTLVNDIGQAVTEYGQSNNDKRYTELGLDIANAASRFFAAGSAINEAYQLFSPDNETALDTISTEAGLPGRSNQTRYGLATGANSDSKVESFMNFMGFKQDQAVLDHLYGLKSDLEMEADIPDPVQRAVVVWLKGQGQRIAQSNFPIVSDIAGKLAGTETNVDWNGGVENRLKSQYSYEAADRLMNGEAKTLTEFLTLNGIDPQWKQFINQAINNRVQTIAGAAPKMVKSTGELSEGSGNEQVEWTINTFLNPRIWAQDDKGVLDNWKDMQKKNPKLFNDTMSFIGGLARAEDERRKNGMELDLNYMKKIGKEGKLQPTDPLAKFVFEKDAKTIADSTAQDDKAIADILGQPALKTSFTEAVADTLGKFGDYIKTEGKEGAMARLDRLEKLTKVIMENTQFTNGYVNALSLMSFETKAGLRNLAKLGVTADMIQSRFPALYDSLMNALSLRGEDTDKPDPKSLSSIVAKSKGSGYTGNNSITELPGVPGKPEKIKPIKYQNSSAKSPSVKGIGPVKSLQELLDGPQMRSALQGARQLQTREDLATFSKPMNPQKI